MNHLLTSKELAVVLNIHIKTLYKFCREGLITPLVLPSGDYRFHLQTTLRELLSNIDTPEHIIANIVATWDIE